MSNQSCQCGGSAHGACNTEFQYAVKIVCGQVVAQENLPTPVVPGQYSTATNIHNPTKCEDIVFRWKLAVANPGEPGPVLAYSRPITLRPDQAIEIDCEQVMRAFAPQPRPRFVKGFLVIESPSELDVVAVYTGSAGPCASNSFHTERVPARCVPVCEDLSMSLNTGFAGWQTVSPSVGPAVRVSPVAGGWSAPPFGAQWISERVSDGTSGQTYQRRYELCFNLCLGFTVPQSFQIQALSDGPANVFLNGNAIGTVSNWNTPTTLSVNPNFLRAGRNCFQVDVVNGGQVANPTGFALAGNLFVAKGRCPCSPLSMAPPPAHGPAGELPPDVTQG